VLIYHIVWGIVHIFESPGSGGGPPFAEAKRPGTYFNCSLFGHEVAQLGAQIPHYLHKYLCINIFLQI